MGKKHSKNWAEIQQDFNSMAEMSCIPSGIKKLRGDHVIDMDQSVRWNQEQVRLNNEKYQEEVKRLNREKNKRRDAIYEDIYQKIQEEVGAGLTRGGGCCYLELCLGAWPRIRHIRCFEPPE